MTTWAMVMLVKWGADVHPIMMLLSMIVDAVTFFFVAVAFAGWPKG